MKTLITRGAVALFLLVVLSVPSTSHAFYGDAIGQVLKGISAFRTEVLTASIGGLVETQIQAILSLLQSFGADQATINNVESALRGTSSGGTVIFSATSTLSASLDSSSPSYAIVLGGSRDVPLAAFRFHATGEDVRLAHIRLALEEGQPSDLEKLTLWNGTTKIGEAIFLGNSYATNATFSLPVTVYKSSDTVITVKGDLARIGTGQPGHSGNLIRIALQFDPDGFYGTGTSSGTRIQATGVRSVAEGVRIFKSIPTVALDTLPSTGLADGRLMRFKVTADSYGPVSLAQIAVRIAGLSSGIDSQVDIYGYTDSNYSDPIAGFTAGGIIGGSISTGSPGAYLWFPQPVQVPAGGTRYFELRDSTKGSGVVNGATALTTTLLGQGVGSSEGMTSATSLMDKDVAFVWSPNSITNSSFSTNDWTHGYGVPGLPSSGLVQTRTGSASSTSSSTPPSNGVSVTASGYYNGRFYVTSNLSDAGETYRTLYRGTTVIIGGHTYELTSNSGVGYFYLTDSAASVVKVGDSIEVLPPTATVTGTGYHNGNFYVTTSQSGAGQAYRSVKKGEGFFIGGKLYQTIGSTGVGNLYFSSDIESAIRIGLPVEKRPNP